MNRRASQTERPGGRAPDKLRPVKIAPGYLSYPEGSALIELGQTRVICTASVEDKIPPHAKAAGTGWVSAEYAMLPRSTNTRQPREVNRGRPGGRTQEIQRLIGRSLRAITDLKLLGERTIWLDADVLQADGGTRTAAITGSYVALWQAVNLLRRKNILLKDPLQGQVAAVSVGIIDGMECLDLNYEEDSTAAVDFNVVMTSRGRLVEVQGTAEKKAFSRRALIRLVRLASRGIRQLMEEQTRAISEAARLLPPQEKLAPELFEK